MSIVCPGAAGEWAKLKFKIEIPQKKKSITPQKTNMEPDFFFRLEKEMHNLPAVPAVHFQGCNFCYPLQPSKCWQWLLKKEKQMVAPRNVMREVNCSWSSQVHQVRCGVQWPGWSWLSDLLYRHITYHDPPKPWKITGLGHLKTQLFPIKTKPLKMVWFGGPMVVFVCTTSTENGCEKTLPTLKWCLLQCHAQCSSVSSPTLCPAVSYTAGQTSPREQLTPSPTESKPQKKTRGNFLQLTTTKNEKKNVYLLGKNPPPCHSGKWRLALAPS